MVVNNSIVKFSIGDKLKQTKPGKHLHELEFPSYPTHVRLCVVDAVKEYLARTKPLRGIITSLFVTCVKPYKAASKDTMSQWVKTTLELAGIDLSRFKPHSIRSASASTAAVAKVPVDTILELLVGQDFALLKSITRNQFNNMENWQKFCWTVHSQ